MQIPSPEGIVQLRGSKVVEVARNSYFQVNCVADATTPRAPGRGVRNRPTPRHHPLERPLSSVKEVVQAGGKSAEDGTAAVVRGRQTRRRMRRRSFQAAVVDRELLEHCAERLFDLFPELPEQVIEDAFYRCRGVLSECYQVLFERLSASATPVGLPLGPMPPPVAGVAPAPGAFYPVLADSRTDPEVPYVLFS